MTKRSGSAIAAASRLPDRYHMITLSPSRIVCPPSSVSQVAVRRMCASGVCQRTISGTIESTSAGLARSFAHSSGWRDSASRPPVMELRVVSLPPTISSTRLPMYSRGDMFRVEAPWASIDTRSVRGGALTRSFHSRVKYAAILPISAARSSHDATTRRSTSGFAVAQSDQWVSSRRSSSGKSNSVASISVVSSIDTRSTQSKVSPRGRSSSTRQVRSRISRSMFARFAGATIGLTARRWTSCFGGSIAMNIWSRSVSGRSTMTMPPRLQSDE